MTPSDQQQSTAPPPVMTSDQIMQHIDSVYQGLPDPVKQALDHAHTLTGGAPSTSVGDVTTAPPPVPPRSLGEVAGGPDQARDLLSRTGSKTSVEAAPAPLSPSKASPMMDGAPPPDQPESGAVSVPGAINGVGAAAPPPVAATNPHQAEYERLTRPPIEGPTAHTSLNTGVPGYEQIHNPWLRGLATVGNAIGSGLAPGVARFVPGTSAHHDLLVNQQAKAVGEEQAGAKSAADTARTNAETANLPITGELQKAETQNYLTEAQARENPALKPFTEPVIDPKDPTHAPRIGYYDEHHPGQVTYGPAVGAKPTAPHQPTNEIEAFLQAPENKDRPIGEALKDFWEKKATATGEEKAKPLTAETAATLNSAWNSLAPKYHLAENPFREHMSDSEVKHVQDSMNAIVQRDQGATRITIDQGKAGAAKANVPSAVENVNPKFLQHAVTGYEKISNEYQNAQSANDDIQTALDEAKKGNKLAYAYEPVLGVLTINTAAGVKRINMPEIASYAGAGSLGDKIIGYFGKQTEGKSIPDNILKDMGEFHQSLASNSAKKYNAKIDIINKTYGANYPHETAQGGKGGSSTVHYVEGSDSYDIPSDKVAAFEAAHKGAKRQ